MSHVGVICPNTRGHINAMMAVSNVLRSRGHRMTFFPLGVPPSTVTSAGIDVGTLGETMFPPALLVPPPSDQPATGSVGVPAVPPAPATPFRRPLQQPPTNAPPDFPWSQLDGRPLVYASLGTLTNRLVQVFRAILDGLASARSLQTVRAVDNPRCRRRCSIIASTPATSEKALPAVAGSISGTAVTAIP